ATIRKPAATRAAPAAATPGSDVVVTASKQRVPLLRYPGSLSMIGADDVLLDSPATDLSEIGRDLPILQNTELGPGRNKLFIRGIADSSFNGATQSTASTYLGDVQIGFSEQDPNLKLYDMAAVQVLEGPQGTLYGSGAIGGIIRLLPNPVDLGAAGAELAGGATLTRSGRRGGDASGVVNMPLLSGRAGLRLVGYDEHEGGYIDDVGRRLADVNRIDTAGGRATLRIAPGVGWSIELGGVLQRISAADGQYADTAVGPLERRSMVAQPFSNAVSVASVRIEKDWPSGLQLLSVTGLALYTSSDVFDATPSPTRAMPRPAAQVYTSDGDKRLASQELRLSRSPTGGISWVAGVSLLSDRDGTSRALGRADAPVDIIGVTNATRTASAFGEVTVPASATLSTTFGGRVTLARTDGEPSFRPRVSDFVLGRSTARFDPTVALSWRLAPGLAAYARVQSGYRTGGLAVAPGIGRVGNFAPDSIRVAEVGVRRLRGGTTGVAFSSAVSLARWTDIQADLVNRRGLPYTLTLGNARILAVEATVDWVPVRGLRASASGLFTDNRIDGALAMLSTPAHRRLPETPSFAAMADIAYQRPVGAGVASVGGSASYVGRSVLGAGDLLDISQGNYAVATVRAGWRWRRYELTLTVDNVTDQSANLFAMGNPFSLASRTLATPLRPRSLRLGGKVRW
ncbi:TonB-dependent receptor, partial [Sphingomonas bacterium]|uniref:TonB-dependent receptor n=1 Tax=Sphingomonas bacterium TaxID=1895847 RepID=UPI001576862A